MDLIPIGQARGAQMFLTHALNCPTSHPARDCSTMIATLERLVDGTTVDQLVARAHLITADAERGWARAGSLAADAEAASSRAAQ